MDNCRFLGQLESQARSQLKLNLAQNPTNFEPETNSKEREK